jgi:hypothetical protein
MITKKLAAAALAVILSGAMIVRANAAPPVRVTVPGPMFGSAGTWAPFAIMGFAGGIIIAALVANARDHRELTAKEAASGGILFWFSGGGYNGSGSPDRKYVSGYFAPDLPGLLLGVVQKLEGGGVSDPTQGSQLPPQRHP